jgi:cell division protein FtsQ
MDGEGSLARSVLRSLRPEADLKAAAIGAVVLLREWLHQKREVARAQAEIIAVAASKAKAKTNARSKSKAVPAREPPPRVVALVERFLPRRIGIILTVILLTGAAALGIVKGGHLQDFIVAVADARNALANSAGFRITSVVINGRKQLTQDEILATGGVNGRSSLLFLDADGVRDKLKANPWIADATVLKLYPGQLQIDITERKAFALWQEAGRLSVVADDGAVLEPYVSRRFLSLPLVVGKGADTKARDFLALLARYPQVRSATKAAIFVGERRWNLRLKDGLDVRLPEQDVGNALAALSKLDREEKLFSKDLVAIDLRLPDRLIVQLSDDAAKAREDQLKAKQPKKKAGDSA